MPPFISRCQSRLLALSSKQLPLKSLQSQVFRSHETRRGLITSSAPPPINVAVERPETIVLVESSLYRQQWKDSFASFYPSQGLHFTSLDIATPIQDAEDEEDTTLDSMEQTLSADLDGLSSSAHTILIARGPIQSLVAQYYLESLSLAGLVLIDSLILPEDGRVLNDPCQGGEERWRESVTCLLNMLDVSLVQEKTINSTQPRALMEPPLDLTNDSLAKSSLPELKLLKSLPMVSSRPLHLEAYSVPLLVMYSGHHVHQEDYKNCAEQTAKFHTGNDDINTDNLVLKIPARKDESGVIDGDYLPIARFY
eukprot:CCRYP_000346-RA/>CCRYP_000346-RA protein AED:0.02 eAED:0.02 QI:67/1/1/1/0/0/2/0/309